MNEDRIGKREGLTKKQMNVLIKENTILREEMSELIVELYGQFTDNKNSARMEGSHIANLQWSAIALRQTQKG